MTKAEKDMATFVSGFEKTVAKKLRELQSTQSFDGTLRIKLDRVFVDKKDGQRALKHLRQLNTDRFAKAK